MTDWTYYEWDEKTGYLRNERGSVDIFVSGQPACFASRDEAEAYLIEHDIRGTIR